MIELFDTFCVAIALFFIVIVFALILEATLYVLAVLLEKFWFFMTKKLPNLEVFTFYLTRFVVIAIILFMIFSILFMIFRGMGLLV